MAKLVNLKSDLDKEREGVWVQYLLDTEFKIARAQSPEFKAALRAIVKKRRKGGVVTDLSNIKDEDLRADLAPIVAKHIIRDWRNIEDDNGNPLPYSPKAAESFLQDPELADLLTWVMEQANVQENYRKETVEEDLGN